MPTNRFTANAPYQQSEYDWYCEDERPVRQLMDAISFGNDLIYDPCCGRGNSLDVAKRRGHPTIGSDIIDRNARHKFFRGNILTQVRSLPTMEGRETSIICNPPYGYIEDIAENIMRRVLEWNVRRAAFLVPIAFQASQGRYSFFTRECRPSHIAVLSQRISCPPGHMIEVLEEKAFEGGRLDYIWVVFTRPHRFRTETIWLQPD
jgi:hypothetical protein